MKKFVSVSLLVTFSSFLLAGEQNQTLDSAVFVSNNLSANSSVPLVNNSSQVLTMSPFSSANPFFKASSDPVGSSSKVISSPSYIISSPSIISSIPFKISSGNPIVKSSGF